MKVIGSPCCEGCSDLYRSIACVSALMILSCGTLVKNPERSSLCMIRSSNLLRKKLWRYLKVSLMSLL